MRGSSGQSLNKVNQADSRRTGSVPKGMKRVNLPRSLVTELSSNQRNYNSGKCCQGKPRKLSRRVLVEKREGKEERTDGEGKGKGTSKGRAEKKETGKIFAFRPRKYTYKGARTRVSIGALQLPNSSNVFIFQYSLRWKSKKAKRRLGECSYLHQSYDVSVRRIETGFDYWLMSIMALFYELRFRHKNS